MATLDSEKVTVWQKVLDDALEAGLTSSFLESSPAVVQWNGGKTIKIAHLQTDGFADYDRDGTGFVEGNGSLVWVDYIVRHDRGVSFEIDVMDLDETASIKTTAAMMNNFVKYHEVPEIDATRYSSIWGGIVDSTDVRYGFLTAAAATILTQIKTDIGTMRNVIGDTDPLVLVMSRDAYTVLTNSTELSKQLQVVDTPIRGINTQVLGIDGVPIVPVPSARMSTEYLFKAGGTDNFGFASRPWAQKMDYILMATAAAKAFVKHQTIRYFSAAVNQAAEKDKAQTRVFHDCWVMSNKLNGIFVRLETAVIATIDAVFGAGAVAAGSGKITVTLGDYFDVLPDGYKVYAKDTGAATAPDTPAPYDDIDISTYTEITVKTATDVTVTTGNYSAVVLVTDGGKVVSFQTAIAT